MHVTFTAMCWDMTEYGSIRNVQFLKIENKRCHSNIKSHEHYKVVPLACVDITEYDAHTHIRTVHEACCI